MAAVLFCLMICAPCLFFKLLGLYIPFLCHFLTEEVIPKLTTEQDAIIYSDGCTGQNRNAPLANAILNIAKLFNVTIIQKYLDVGHTQMEVDSMHSTIERRLRNVKINVPADYVHICSTARVNPKPYSVYYFTHDFFKKFNAVQSHANIRPGKKTGDPHVTDLRALAYFPDGTIHYKLNHSDEWKLLQVRAKNIPAIHPEQLPPLYTSRLPIKRTKYNHLQYLKKSLLPDYHCYYDNIPVIDD